MNKEFTKKIQSDFDRARTKEIIATILSLLKNENDELLSFHDVKSILKPGAHTYKGVIPVKLSLIIGSEGRYKDFNKLFLPRHQHLRFRWERINLAHYKNVILPPIKLYEIGGVYFVRDGNHRVSVAKTQGVEFIDAEVVSLNSIIELHPDMTREYLKNVIIEFEKKRFYRTTKLDKLRLGCDLSFTTPGRYDEIIKHIQGHKYYINLEKKDEIPFQQAMLSWYDNVYCPIIKIIEDEKILNRFPDRTPADLYVWIVSTWHELKEQYGEDYSLKQAAINYSQEHGSGTLKRIKEILLGFVKRIFNRESLPHL
ncbi:MAG: transcriptional regulator [Spirochaetales bacterium]|nr:transcriptional regulator [Spirochaetales bacterium]